MTSITFDDDEEEENLHDGFKFERSRAVGCDECGCGVHRTKVHIVPGKGACLFLCDDCFKELNKENEVVNAEEEFTNIIENFAKKLTKAEKREDEENRSDS